MNLPLKTTTSTTRAVTLTELANRFESDKGDRFRDRHGYSYLYDLLLGPSRDEPISLLEIGLAICYPDTEGGLLHRKVDSPSLAMWLSYFSKAHIYGFDISDFSHLVNDRFTFIRGDAGSRSDLERLGAIVPTLDVIIDDGSHAAFHQQHCLKHLWATLKPGGLYIIEDLHHRPRSVEAELPQVPLTAALIEAAFERGMSSATAVFTAGELRVLRRDVDSYAIFRDHEARDATPKLLVLRKRAVPIELAAEPFRSPQQSVSAPDGADVASATPSVRSFDVFDTLVARRCIHPRGVFDMQEARTAIAGFAADRMAAEASLAPTDYSLHDIYVAFGQRRPDLVPRLAELEALEIQLEFENLIPIAENVRQVAPGDILVSDMYLPDHVVGRIIREVTGLRDVTLFLSTHGKGRGTIWPRILEECVIVDHLGDNIDTDLRSPAAYGIKARHTGVSEPTAFERHLIADGFPRLGEAAREARLTMSSNDPEERALQQLQANLNAPMLLLATMLVLRAARQAGVSQILASGRDCFLWLSMIRRLQEEFAPGVSSEYFFTGRVPRTFPSDNYKAYVRALAGDKKTFMLDICGTGYSMQKLCDQLDLRDVQPIVVQKMFDFWKANRLGRRPGPRSPVLALLDPDLRFDNELVELANSAPHPTVFDVVVEAGVACPVFPNWPTRPVVQRFQKAQDEAFAWTSARLLTRPVIDEIAGSSSAKLSRMLTMLYGSFPAFAGTLTKARVEHCIENEAIMSVLKTMGKAEEAKAAQEPVSAF